MLRNAFSTAPVTGTAEVVVSLTSYGHRVQSVAIAIESIARGSVRPARLILWLDDDEQIEHIRLPRSLLRLERRGLEIKISENFGPHSKYYSYVVSNSPHQLPMVTADDDIMYPHRWLERLCDAYAGHPEAINCHWARSIRANNGGLADYESWPACRTSTASPGHFAVGVSGVIYPPMMLDELARHGRRFVDVCPKADDIWLHWVALRLGIKIRQISGTAHHFPIIPGTQRTGLVHQNVAQGGNDHWIRQIYAGGDVEAIANSMTE